MPGPRIREHSKPKKGTIKRLDPEKAAGKVPRRVPHGA